MQSYQILEKKYADFTGSKYCVSVSSGTSALHLALLAIGVKQGDEVIVPDFTMAACGFAVHYCGAKVVTVDCKNNLTIDTSLIEAKITPKTKAIMAVHIYGRLCDMEEIIKIAKKYDLKVIEDACEAQGAVYNSKADITCYSLFKNKIIHAEEGGLITTNSLEYAEDIRDLKNMAFGDQHDYFHKRIGYNYRMPNSQAEMAIKSLQEYDSNKVKRRIFEKKWKKFYSTKKRNAVWVYDIICKDSNQKNIFTNELDEKKVEWRHFFKPLSMMPMFAQDVGQNAYSYSKRGFYICFNN